MNASAAVRARGLACGYEKRRVLEGLDFEIPRGRLTGILGPNGGGKSTLVKTLMGLLPPLAGSYAIGGSEGEALKPALRAREAAYVPQHAEGDEAWTVADLVALGRYVHAPAGWLRAADRLAIDEAIAAVGLSELRDRRMGELSGGQRQRAYLARALAQEAPLLMLDEPTAALDLGHQVAFYRLMRERLEDRRLSVVAVLHDLNLAAQFCDRLLVLHEGMLLAEGTPEAVLTPEIVAEAFGLGVEIRRHPESGRPYVLPTGLGIPAPARVLTAPLGARRKARLHVVCGGGSGERLLPALYRRGYELSVGVLNALDTDEALARRLGAAVLTEAPFSPISARASMELGEKLSGVEGIVVAEVAWGSGNLANLEALLAPAAAGVPIWWVSDSQEAVRDFTAGSAEALYDRLQALGARTVSSDRLFEALQQRFG